MENFVKIKKTTPKLEVVDIPIKPVLLTSHLVSKNEKYLEKNKYLSEFETEDLKKMARNNLGILPDFKIVGEFDSLEELETNIPVGNEAEGYIVENDIYAWSSALNKWYRYTNKAFVSPYIIKGIDELDPILLYDILTKHNNDISIVGTIGPKSYELTVTTTNNKYIITFTDENELNTITVFKDLEDGQYKTNWTYITYN